MITGTNIRLRALEKKDLKNYVRWLNDRDVIEYLDIYSPMSKEMEEKWYESQLSMPTGAGHFLSVDAYVEKQWMHIGDVALMNVVPVSNNAEFVILIGEKSCWNKGYGREATYLTLKHGFEDLNLNRIYLHVFEEHIRAIASYKAAGFQQEGFLREAIYKDGRYHNMLLMSILHSDWNLQLESKC